MAFTPSCSVIVCTRNRPDDLERCLAALARVTYSPFETVVVDNAPDDNRAQAAAARWGARYVLEPLLGLSRARNTGARACSSEIVVFVDDDAVPDADWLARLIVEFRDPTVTIVTGRTLPLPGGAGGEAIAQYSSDLGEEVITLDRQHPYWFEMACFGGVGRGCNMAFRRRVFDDERVFDERVGKGVLGNGDEHRAFGRLVARGHKARYTPAAVVRHPFPRTMEELRAHYVRSLSDLTAYVTFLFLWTGFRWRVAKYALEAALGKKRPWRARPESAPPHLVSRGAVLRAYLKGVGECLRGRRVR